MCMYVYIYSIVLENHTAGVNRERSIVLKKMILYLVNLNDNVWLYALPQWNGSDP